MANNTNTVTNLTVKSRNQIRDDILRTIKNGIISQGLSTNPNVSISSLFGIVASSIADEAAIAENNCITSINQLMPDTATGLSLDRWLALYNIPRRSATSAVGAVIVSATSPAFVPLGAQLINQSTGIVYAVTVGGTYKNGDEVEVSSIQTGPTANLSAGSTLVWANPPPFFNPKATVSTINPLTDAATAEDDETARARLLALLAYTPGAGNPPQLIQFAVDSDAHVQSACVYPAARGPSTFDITVFGYGTTVSPDRNLDVVIFNNKVVPFIQGQIAQNNDGYISNVINQDIDISIGLTLPVANSFFNPSPGGGWLDATPLEVTAAKPAIRVVDGYALSGNNPSIPKNTATGFWVDCPVAPIAGNIYSISYLSPITLTLFNSQTNGTYNTFAHYGVGGHTTLYYFQTNSPFYKNINTSQIIQPGSFIFPTAQNTSIYVQNFIAYMFSMGPGERVSIAGLLPRAARFPLETFSFPYKLDNRLLKPIINSGNEVADGVLLFRGDGGTTDGSLTDYASNVGDTCYAQYAPRTAYIANVTSKGDSYIFRFRNFGIYKQ